MDLFSAAFPSNPPSVDRKRSLEQRLEIYTFTLRQIHVCVTKMFKDKFPGKNNNNDLEWTKDIGLVWTKSVLVANLQPNDRRSAGTSLTLEGLKKQQPTNTTLNHSLLFLPTQTEPYRKEPVQKLSRDASDLPTRFMDPHPLCLHSGRK